MRRVIVERLSAQKWLSGENVGVKMSPVKVPAYKYPYLYNISNRLSREFYAVDALTAYELKGGEGPVMQCRHCIRYSLGYCVKRGGKRPEWREPLSLVLGDGRRFRLEFDCAQCQMNVYAP
jgi:putative protease